MAKRNAQVHCVPWNYDILSDPFQIKPDGVLISNGPGSPLNAFETVQNLKKFMHHQFLHKYSIPIFGICMGNQLLGLAAGYKVEKLLYGNRGHNQPVINLETEKCVLTSQNHGYALKDSDQQEIPSDWKTLFRNANDGSNEGIKHLLKPWSSVQFHPEAMGGPLDTMELFDDFMDNVYHHSNNH